MIGFYDLGLNKAATGAVGDQQDSLQGRHQHCISCSLAQARSDFDFDDEGLDEQMDVHEQQGSQKLGHTRPIGGSPAIARSDLDGCGSPGEVTVYKREGSSGLDQAKFTMAYALTQH